MSDEIYQYIATSSFSMRGYIVVGVTRKTPERVKRGKRPRRGSPLSYTIIAHHHLKSAALKNANVLNTLNNFPIFDPKHFR